MNEVTTTEATAAEAQQTPLQFAEEFIKTHSLSEIAEQLVQYSSKVDSLTLRNQEMLSINGSIRTELNNWKKSVGDFIKDHVKEDEVTVEDLKEFASELDIELTKTIRITFNIEVEGEFIVPLDFDEDNVDENDFFDIRIDANPSDNDIEIDSEAWRTDDLEVDEI